MQYIQDKSAFTGHARATWLVLMLAAVLPTYATVNVVVVIVSELRCGFFDRCAVKKLLTRS